MKKDHFYYFFQRLLRGRSDTQPDDIQHNDTQHNDSQYYNTQYDSAQQQSIVSVEIKPVMPSVIMLSVVMPSVVMLSVIAPLRGFKERSLIRRTDKTLVSRVDNAGKLFTDVTYVFVLG